MLLLFKSLYKCRLPPKVSAVKISAILTSKQILVTDKNWSSALIESSK